MLCVVQVTVKDVRNVGQQNDQGIQELCDSVEHLLRNAKNSVIRDEGVLDNALQSSVKDNGSGGLIGQLSDKLATFIGYNSSGELTGCGIGNDAVVYNKAPAGDTYQSAYTVNGKWDKDANNGGNNGLCARIFLGCVPLIFSGLSYFYWQCSGDESGVIGGLRWVCTSEKGKLKSHHDINDPNSPLGTYMVSMGYDTKQLQHQRIDEYVGKLFRNDIKIVEPFKGAMDLYSGNPCPFYFKKLLEASFKEFEDANTKVTGAYSPFIKEILNNTKNGDRSSQTAITTPLSTLYVASQYHFSSIFANGDSIQVRCINNSDDVPTLLGKKGTTKIEFVTGKSPADVIDLELSSITHHLLTPCFNAAFVLLTIQGTLTFEKGTDTISLYSIYSNTAFGLHFPNSVNQWFGVLWEVIYHLLVQLYFIWERCRVCLLEGCGWRYCGYGYGINVGEMTYWICQNDKPSGSLVFSHKDCSEAGCSENHTECGKQRKCSPLQAALCDEVDPFRCRLFKEHEAGVKAASVYKRKTIVPCSLPYSSHTTHRKFNQYCPVPMGFKNWMTKFGESRRGDALERILRSFIDKTLNEASLYNLVLCLSSFSARTPRTVGNMFGFFSFLAE
ncbi:uncharacterized protein BXIN_1534 [Babesia sp. Xinjiang]|uniref:uncharacterized protein n=1 Tax=Babesia sp. Xinjiang TaxID=462227 RepID=UPI000A25C246|nr:uncharacterized protein BXIN_1534 [Babesia sp. Xinjiang]ORM42294.1 hypothetical protein BXIN_1534 [Babesia sp. Xinjiang]